MMMTGKVAGWHLNYVQVVCMCALPSSLVALGGRPASSSTFGDTTRKACAKVLLAPFKLAHFVSVDRRASCICEAGPLGMANPRCAISSSSCLVQFSKFEFKRAAAGGQMKV